MSRPNSRMETRNQLDYAILFNVENNLETWITTELDRRGWSIRELARRGGISHTAINNALSGSARLDTYKAIAKGLDVSLIDVLQYAGEIPPQPEPVSRERECLELFRRIEPIYHDLALRVLHEFARTPNHSFSLQDIAQRLKPGESVIVRDLSDNPFFRALGKLHEVLSDHQIDRLIDLMIQIGQDDESGGGAPVLASGGKEGSGKLTQ